MPEERVTNPVPDLIPPLIRPAIHRGRHAIVTSGDSHDLARPWQKLTYTKAVARCSSKTSPISCARPPHPAPASIRSSFQTTLPIDSRRSALAIPVTCASAAAFPSAKASCLRGRRRAGAASPRLLLWWRRSLQRPRRLLPCGISLTTIHASALIHPTPFKPWATAS